jgi:hypothetical protein
MASSKTSSKTGKASGQPKKPTKTAVPAPKPTPKVAAAPAPGVASTPNAKTAISNPGINTPSMPKTVGATLVPANVIVVFTSGIGQLTASLFRNGMMINMQSVNASGTIFFSDVQSDDMISINGVCTGNASVTVSVPTNPATPQTFEAGPIHTGLIVL